jgi:hypothetical protein
VAQQQHMAIQITTVQVPRGFLLCRTLFPTLNALEDHLPTWIGRSRKIHPH